MRRMKQGNRSIKQSSKGMKSWLKTFLLASCLGFVVISTISCCSTPPPEVQPAKEFQSLEQMEKGDRAPERGWFMNDEDFEDLLDILAETVRESSDD